MADAAAPDLAKAGRFLQELARLCRRYKYSIYANMRSVPYDPDGIDLGGLVLRDELRQDMLRGWVVWTEGIVRSDLVGGPVYATVDEIDDVAIQMLAELDSLDAMPVPPPPLADGERPEVQAIRESIVNLSDVAVVAKAHAEAEAPALSLDQIGPMIDTLEETLRSFDDQSNELGVCVRETEERLCKMWRIPCWVLGTEVPWDLGWMKAGKRWRIVIRSHVDRQVISADYRGGSIVHHRSSPKLSIPFSESSRLARLEAAPLLPKLIEAMNSRAAAQVAARAGVGKGSDEAETTVVRHVKHVRDVRGDIVETVTGPWTPVEEEDGDQ